MKIMGFNFTKISIERMRSNVQDLKINTNIDIISLKNVETDLIMKKEEILQIKFAFSIKYEPVVADIILEGSLLLSLDSHIAKDTIKRWEKKDMDEELRVKIFNIILRKSNVKALQLEEDMALPLHLPLPSVKLPEKSSEVGSAESPKKSYVD